METNRIYHAGILIGLIALTSLALATTSKVSLSETAWVRTALPASVIERPGKDLLYCHNHGRAGAPGSRIFEGQSHELTHCPECNDPLSSKNIGEAIALPDSTDIVKKRYRQPGKSPITASIVLSGSDRSSLHRPIVCIRSQAFTVENDTHIDVPIDGREPLQVRIYDLASQMQDGKTGHSYFAFWYVGKDRETTSHFKRMFWMGVERLIENEANRWAYVSVTGSRAATGDAHHAEIKEFIGDFYPAIRKE